jgi:WhiB family transcriptional regulator, redox-sensing transcriptional regulator
MTDVADATERRRRYRPERGEVVMGRLLFEQFAQPWRAQAACRTIDPALFFPDTDDDERLAKAVCAGCPVQGECLLFAFETRESNGVWGGLNEQELRRARRRWLAEQRGGWADRFRAVIEAEGWTHEEAARVLDVGRSSVSHWVVGFYPLPPRIRLWVQESEQKGRR